MTAHEATKAEAFFEVAEVAEAAVNDADDGLVILSSRTLRFFLLVEQLFFLPLALGLIWKANTKYWLSRWKSPGPDQKMMMRAIKRMKIMPWRHFSVTTLASFTTFYVERTILSSCFLRPCHNGKNIHSPPCHGTSAKYGDAYVTAQFRP